MSSISLCMIVRNEEEVLGRCLDSVKDLVDEIVVVDTGSTDATREIALQYGARVFDFVWADDFSAARNFSLSRATMDYCLWLDADDVLLEPDREKLRQLKEALNPSIHLVMMKYNTGFDEAGNPVFSFYRERIFLRSLGYRFEGAVHEAVTPSGNIVYADIAVTHRKLKAGDSGRNLRIFERQLAEGKPLAPREQFYYARELTYHDRDEDAIAAFNRFLDEGRGWVENNINACCDLAGCFERKGDLSGALCSLFRSFEYDAPRAEACCAIGQIFMARTDYRTAAFWYELALSRTPNDASGGFVLTDCYGYLPAIQLCVCYDRLGEREKAEEYNNRALAFKPDDAAALYNKAYFESFR